MTFTRGYDLWSRVQINGIDDCWPWLLKPSRNGYGQVNLSRGGVATRTYAHRLAYEQVYGPLPPGMNACHRCDNPPCCNPLHLFAGTWLENMQDKISKGRQAQGERSRLRLYPETVLRGEGHPHARLTQGAVQEIRAQFAAGVPQTVIAQRFAVHAVTIHDVVRGKTWKGVAS